MERQLVSILFPKSDNPEVTFGKIIQFASTFIVTIGIIIWISEFFPIFFVHYIDPLGSPFGVFFLIALYYFLYAFQTLLMKLLIPKRKKR